MFLASSKVKRSYKCTICPGDKNFENITQLVQHLLNHNSLNVEDKIAQKSDQPSSYNYESKLFVYVACIAV